MLIRLGYNQNMLVSSAVAIYVHIPFCQVKCFYCDFAAYAGMRSKITPYVEALTLEAGRLPTDAGRPLSARTLYFGGGTPSLLGLAHFERLLSALPAQMPGCEITVEANPATVDFAYLNGLRALGVNRLSLGLQSLDDSLLASIGRQHNVSQGIESYQLARRAGFGNISLDLIYGLPGQALDGWEHTLRGTIELDAEHLSLYGLTVEEGTVFGRRRRRGELEVPDEDAQADMYDLAGEMLSGAGYEHYEISNWARRRPGQETRAVHNLVYWRNEPYLGLGASAHSFYAGRRFANTPSVEPYIRSMREGRSPVAEDEANTPALEMAETMMLGLRLSEGVSFERFEKRFGRPMKECYGAVIEELASLELLVVSDSGIALAPSARLLGNQVFSRFLSPKGSVI